jgi:hypothetical protein
MSVEACELPKGLTITSLDKGIDVPVAIILYIKLYLRLPQQSQTTTSPLTIHHK